MSTSFCWANDSLSTCPPIRFIWVCWVILQTTSLMGLFVMSLAFQSDLTRAESVLCFHPWLSHSQMFTELMSSLWTDVQAVSCFVRWIKWTLADIASKSKKLAMIRRGFLPSVFKQHPHPIWTESHKTLPIRLQSASEWQFVSRSRNNAL